MNDFDFNYDYNSKFYLKKKAAIKFCYLLYKLLFDENMAPDLTNWAKKNNIYEGYG